LDVSFRTLEDNEEVMRTDSIDYSNVADYGFDLVSESFDFFGEEFEDDEILEEEKIELDEEELVMFLNEYYTINPDALPKSEFY
jgi:hypothetical protein